jgi:hypothetical protein
MDSRPEANVSAEKGKMIKVQADARQCIDSGNWCREYIEATVALNNSIQKRKMADVGALLEKRQSLLEELPKLTPPAAGTEQEKEFLNDIDTIMSLEKKSTELIKLKQDDIIDKLGRLKRATRSLPKNGKEKSVSKFIDTRR